MKGLGFAMLCTGTAMADNGNLIPPALCIVIGTVLIWIGIGEDE